MRAIAALFLSITGLFSLALRPFQSQGFSFVGLSHTYEFGHAITFMGSVQDPSAVEEINLLMRPTGQDTRVLPVILNPDGSMSAEFNLESTPLRPFTTIEYWFRATLKDGSSQVSEPIALYYEDNRFNWEVLESDGLKVHWVEGDLAFGQASLNVIENSLETVRAILDVPFPMPLHIYIYPTAPDLQAALKLSNTPWAAGHASPDLGVILISIMPGPDQRAEMERQIPHELMHILQYQVAGEDYTHLPTWLIEGLASIAELYPNQDYQLALQKAIDTDSLTPMTSLCQGFPRDLSGAFLAYAQSASFTQFLSQNYGSSGMIHLMNQYRNQLGCEEGVQAAFGQSLSDLESRWKQEVLGIAIGERAWNNLRPYLVISLIVLLPGAALLLPGRSRRQSKNPARP